MRISDWSSDVCSSDLHEEQVVDVVPRVVPPLVPALGAALQRLVVALLVLLDQALETHVASNFETEVVALQEQQQTRHAPVAVQLGRESCRERVCQYV